MLPSGQALSELLGALYDAASNPASWEEFLRLLARETGATSAGFLIYDAEQHSYKLSARWQVDPEAAKAYEQYYGALDVWAQRGLTKPAGFVCNSEALARSPEMKTTEIYNDFMVRFGIEHGMFAAVQNTGSRITSVSLYRAPSQPQFERSEIEILRFLLPHVDRAVGLYGRFSQLTDRSAGFEAALNSMATGVIFLGPEGRVFFMNRSASEIVSERDGLVMTNAARLRAERAAESDRLSNAIRGAARKSNDGNVGGAMLVSRHGRPPLQVLVGPVSSSAALNFGFADSISAVAFVTDPARRQRPGAEVLRAMFGLSPAECRVALLLSDGHATREICDILGVTANTVRSQIKSVFLKTGTRRQAELIRLLITHSAPASPI